MNNIEELEKMVKEASEKMIMNCIRKLAVYYICI